MAYPDIDKIDTEIRHAKAIIELIMDNIGNKVDSDPDAVEYALWAAVKHLREATNEIEDTGEKNLSELLSRVDSDPLGEDEEDDEDKDEDEIIVVSFGINKDGTISLLKDEDK